MDTTKGGTASARGSRCS